MYKKCNFIFLYNSTQFQAPHPIEVFNFSQFRILSLLLSVESEFSRLLQYPVVEAICSRNISKKATLPIMKFQVLDSRQLHGCSCVLGPVVLMLLLGHAQDRRVNSRAFVLCWNLPFPLNNHSVIVDSFHLSVRVSLGQYGTQQYICRINVEEKVSEKVYYACIVFSVARNR